MMDIHKETINMQPCDQYQRVLETELKVNSLKEDFVEVKSDIKLMCEQLTSVTNSLNTVVMRLEERDKNSTENALQNRETFKRFGDKIDLLETGLQKAEVQMQVSNLTNHRLDTLEKIVTWVGTSLAAAVAAIAFWLFQKSIG